MSSSPIIYVDEHIMTFCMFISSRINLCLNQRHNAPDLLKLPDPLTWVMILIHDDRKRATRPDHTGWQMINPLGRSAGELGCLVSLTVTVTCFVCLLRGDGSKQCVGLTPPLPPISHHFFIFLGRGGGGGAGRGWGYCQGEKGWYQPLEMAAV